MQGRLLFHEIECRLFGELLLHSPLSPTSSQGAAKLVLLSGTPAPASPLSVALCWRSGKHLDDLAVDVHSEGTRRCGARCCLATSASSFSAEGAVCRLSAGRGLANAGGSSGQIHCCMYAEVLGVGALRCRAALSPTDEKGRNDYSRSRSVCCHTAVLVEPPVSACKSSKVCACSCIGCSCRHQANSSSTLGQINLSRELTASHNSRPSAHQVHDCSFHLSSQRNALTLCLSRRGVHSLSFVFVCFADALFELFGVPASLWLFLISPSCCWCRFGRRIAPDVSLSLNLESWATWVISMLSALGHDVTRSKSMMSGLGFFVTHLLLVP